MGTKIKTKVYLLVACLPLALAVLFVTFFNTATPVMAATGINSQLSFEGKIVQSSGVNIANGTYNMQFNIYQDGDGLSTNDSTGAPAGSLKWTEDYLVAGSTGMPSTGGVTLTNGTFQVNLGSICAFSGGTCGAKTNTGIDWNQSTLWLSMEVGNTSSCTVTSSTSSFHSACGGDTEMTPMIRLTAVPQAQVAQTANTLGGSLTAANFVQLAQGLQTDTSTTNASIAINKNNSSGTPNILTLQKASSTVLAVDNNGYLLLTPAAITTASNLISQTFTNNSTAAGASNGFSQTITVSNASGTPTTRGGIIQITDATAQSNTNTGLSIGITDNGSGSQQDTGIQINLSGTTSTATQVGVFAGVSRGMGLVGSSSNTGTTQCSTSYSGYSVGVCGTSSSTTNGYGGVFAATGSSAGAALAATNETTTSNIFQLQDGSGSATNVLLVADGGQLTVSPKGNLIGTTIKQTSGTATSGNIFVVSGATANNFIQITQTAANQGAVSISSFGSNDLTLDSGSALLKLGSTTTTIQKAGGLIIDLASAATNTLTVSNSNGANVASVSATGDIGAGSGRVFKVGASSGQNLTACSSSQFIGGQGLSGGITTTVGTCQNAATSLASAYNAAATTGNNIILSQNGGGVLIQDNSTPLTPSTTNLFAVQKSAGTVSYLGVTSTGINIQSNATGSAVNALSFDTSTTQPHLKIFGANGTNYADIYYDSSTSTAYYGANTGTAVLGSGTGAVNVTAGAGSAFVITGNAASTITTTAGNLTLQNTGSGNILLPLTNVASVLSFSKTTTLAGNYSANDFTITRALTQGANTGTGAVLKVEDTSTANSSVSIAPDVLLVSQSNVNAGGNLIKALQGGGDFFHIQAGTGNLYTKGSISFDGGFITGSTSLSIDSGTASNLNLATGAASGKAVSLGNANAGSTLILEAGTGAAGIQIGNGATAHGIQIGTGAAIQTLVIGSTNSSSTTTIQGGTNGIDLNLPAGGQVTLAASAAPTVDQMLISNSGFGTSTTGVAGLGINFNTGGTVASADNAGLRIDVTSGNNGATTTLEGLKIGNLTGAQANSTESGLYVGTGWDIGLNLQSSVIQLATTQTTPATPASGNLKVWAKQIAGRSMLKVMGSSGVDYELQPSLFKSNIIMMTPATAATVGGFGQTWTIGAGAGTKDTPTPVTTAPAIANQMHRFRHRNAVTSTNQVMGIQSPADGLQFWSGNAAGLGGYFFQTRFVIEAWPANTVRLFAGMSSSTTAVVASDTVAGDVAGLWHDTTDGANVLSLVTRNNTTTTKTSISGATLAAGQAFDFYMYMKPNDTTLYYRLDSINNGTTLVDTSVVTTLPRNTIFLGPQVEMSNGTANITVNTSGIGVVRIYGESDN